MFSNIDDIYRCIRFVKYIEKGDFGKVADSMEFSNMRYDFADNVRDLSEAEFVSYMRGKVEHKLEEYRNLGISIRDISYDYAYKIGNEWQVELGYSETMEDVIPFIGSKYVQARTGAIYKEAEAFLKQGRKVLFSASPCQIAGLLHYLRKEYENLTTIDFVCHGAPSPKVWQRYLDEVATSGKKAINDIKFRNKSDGWKRFNFILSYEAENNSYSLCSCHQQNHYMRAFLSNLILRPSCHNCQAKQGRSHSEITIADFWGINNEMPEMDDDKGTSLVLVNTERGCQALDWSKVTSKESSIEAASKYNVGL